MKTTRVDYIVKKQKSRSRSELHTIDAGEDVYIGFSCSRLGDTGMLILKGPTVNLVIPDVSSFNASQVEI